MTVSAAQIKAAKAKGLINVEALAVACDKFKVPFYLAATIMQRETGGQNIFGHDAGGAYSVPNKDIQVTEARYKDFLKQIGAGKTSNGVGPQQLTYKGYHIGPASLTARGFKAWVPADNILYGVEILSKSLKTQLAKKLSIEKAFWNVAKIYNAGKLDGPAGTDYANGAAASAKTWAATVGTSDTEVVPVSDFNEKVRWKDTRYHVDRRTYEQLLEVEHIVGHPIVMYQGSWSDGSLSAETHAGAGAADVGPTGGVGWRELETACRKVGMAAWLRSTGTWINDWHIHALSIGNQYMAIWARDHQVPAYLAGFNGLGSNARSGPDTGNRNYVNITWEEYMPSAKDIANEVVNELVREAPRIAKAFLSADVIPSGKDETNPKNLTQVPATFIKGDHDLLVDIREVLKKLAPPKT